MPLGRHTFTIVGRDIADMSLLYALSPTAFPLFHLKSEYLSIQLEAICLGCMPYNFSLAAYIYLF